VSRAEADMLFQKVLHDCDYHGKFLTYGLFCKANMLAAMRLWPGLEGKVAIGHLCAMLDAVSPPHSASELENLANGAMLDPEVLLLLDRARTGLDEVFRAFACRRLRNPGTPAVTSSVVNPAPAVLDRRRHLSLDQFTLFCKEMTIMPDHLSRIEIIQIFKHVQFSAVQEGRAKSNRGYLAIEEFVDAVGLLACTMYSKAPYDLQYPHWREKIEAFLVLLIPQGPNEFRETFLYGCGGRAHGH